MGSCTVRGRGRRGGRRERGGGARKEEGGRGERRGERRGEEGKRRGGRREEGGGRREKGDNYYSWEHLLHLYTVKCPYTNERTLLYRRRESSKHS